MTAKEKIENLTNGWYGLALFAGVVSVFQNGIGVFSLLWTAASTVFSLVLTFFLGRRLLARSSVTRLVLIVLAGLGAVFGVLGVLKLGSAFFESWSVGGLLMIVVSAASVMMNTRSLRVLLDRSVKVYFG